MTAAIRHMVVFNLKHEKDSPAAKQFIEAAKNAFAQIPCAKNVMQCYEISPKNDYDYGFSFDFASPEDYNAYNLHPLHINFVKTRWETEVTRFMEIDLAEIG